MPANEPSRKEPPRKEPPRKEPPKKEPLKIGIVVGREWSFPPAFIEAVAERDAGVVADFVEVGGSFMDEPVPYRVIIDRMSHEIPYYRSYLKNAMLQGCWVINDPFRWAADDKYFDSSVASKVDVAHPRTVALPNKAVKADVSPESFRNLLYPLDWQRIVDYVGLPAILKDAHGGGWKEVYKVNTLEELIWRYDESESLTMVVQEFIRWDGYVRCMCIGREHVLPIRYDPSERKYHRHATAGLSAELYARCAQDALKLCRALGYDMNTVEFAIRDGVPYAIDFMNPAPDMDVYSLTPYYFQWAISHLADLAVRLARSRSRPGKGYSWYQAGSPRPQET
jgi:glutathione synthase/RimK-type ligase-like ATP-grasp enzyme